MSGLAGTGALARLALRRDRVLLPVWLAVFVLMAAGSAAATVGLYPTEASRVRAADTVNSAQSLVALYGRVYDPTSLGAVSMIKMGGLGAVFVAILAIILTVRHTRAEEESGRMDLVGSTVIGRYAALTATLLVMVGGNLVLALATALGLTAAGLPVDGSFAFGLAWAGVGVAFTAIAALVAQLTRSARTATGLSMVILGVVYVLRAVGDTADRTGPRWLVWLSPIGWGQQFRPYAGNRWWVLLITVGFAAVAMAGAYALAARRDVAAGLIPDRAGRAAGARRLRGCLALAWRLHRGALTGWLVAFALLGLIFGNLATSVSGFISSPAARDVFARLGGQKGLIDAFLAAELGFIGIAASAYGISVALRLRGEESDLHAESLLATATTRTRWAASHITIALAGTTALMAVTGLGAGAAYAARTHDAAQVGRVLAAAMAQVPAAWVLTGIVVAAFGLAPRLVAAGWAALVAFVLLGELGPLWRLDQAVMDVSPYAHVPKLPGGAVSATPLVALTLVAAALIAAGLFGLRRRDIG